MEQSTRSSSESAKSKLGGEWAISHTREVMPICVLVQLRALNPNPKGKPYMDHMWN